MSENLPDPGEIGPWSEIKLDIIREYASAYSSILSTRRDPAFRHIYIDGFAGAGIHLSKETGDLVPGSPLNALLVEPAFREFHFVDLSRGKVEGLKRTIGSLGKGSFDPASVFLYNEDCNEVLLTKVFPRARYEDYVRALCLLDPYGLHLDWNVVRTAGEMRSVDIFLNFPIHDMNRNVLRRDPGSVDPDQVRRMTAYWGDDSWRKAAYSTTGDLFGHEEKQDNESVVNAFRERLRRVAGFDYVPNALPMRNGKGATVYYLLFASHARVAETVITSIFKKYRNAAS